MNKLYIIFLSLILASCATNKQEEKGEVLVVNYQLEVAYTNGDIDTLNVEYYIREGEFVGLDLRQNQGVSYIHCESCKDEYLRKVEAIVADVRRFNVLDYSFQSP
jgi:hypothetical protein